MSLPTNFFIGRGGASSPFLSYLPTTFSPMTTWTNGQEGTFGGALTGSNPIGACISRTGTKVFVTGFSNGVLYDITLATAWDLSSYTSVTQYTSLDTKTFGTGHALSGCFWSENGEYFMLSNRNDQTVGTSPKNSVSLFQATAPYDLSTVTHIGTNTSVTNFTNVGDAVNGVSISRDGRYWAVMEQGGGDSYVIKVDTGAGNEFTLASSGGNIGRLLTPNINYNALGGCLDHSGKVVYYAAFNNTAEIYYQVCTSPWSIPSMAQGHSIITLPSTLANGSTVAFHNTCMGGVLPNEGKAIFSDYGQHSVYLYDVA